MVRPADAVLLDELASTPLSGLSRSLGIDVEKWLTVASSPLPRPLRITPNRHDIEWTRKMLESIGGEKIPWMVMSQSWVMPFSKSDYPSEEAKKIIDESGLEVRSAILLKEAADAVADVLA